MSTPTNGSPHDPRSGDSAASGSQHSAPDFGGGQANQQGGQAPLGGSGSGSSHEVPSFGAPSASSSQQGQGGGAPQYRPANGGGGMPQYSPGGGQGGSSQHGNGQYGSTQYGGAQQGGRKGKGKPPLWVGLASLGLGLLLGIIAIIVFLTSVVGGANSIAETPSGTTRTLEADTTYYVFSTEATSVDECTIYTPDFDSKDLETSGTDQTATSEGETFSMLGTFETEEAGEHRLSCSPYVSSDSVYITDVGVGGMLGGAFAGLGLGLLGGLLFVLGIILIIVNRVTASKNRG